MQLIAANIGNSSTQVAVDYADHDHRWLLECIVRGDDPIELNFGEFDFHQEPAFWAVCSVNRERQKTLADWVTQNRPSDLFHVIQPGEVELETNVLSREQLGRDRLVAAWQAVQLNEGGPLVVIDAGTAVTIDLIDKDNVFQGGMILPGAQACFDILSGKTDALPNLSAEGPSMDGHNELGFIGKSTQSAIQLGVYQSQISVMKSAVNDLKSNFGPLEVYLTGGGIRKLVDWLPDDFQHVPDLVLQGATAIGKDLLDQLIRES